MTEAAAVIVEAPGSTADLQTFNTVADAYLNVEIANHRRLGKHAQSYLQLDCICISVDIRCHNRMCKLSCMVPTDMARTSGPKKVLPTHEVRMWKFGASAQADYYSRS